MKTDDTRAYWLPTRKPRNPCQFDRYVHLPTKQHRYYLNDEWWHFPLFDEEARPLTYTESWERSIRVSAVGPPTS